MPASVVFPRKPLSRHLLKVTIDDVKKIIAAMLIVLLLGPVLMDLAAVASGDGGRMSGDACATGKGHDCMEGDRCTLNHRECRMHAHKRQMSHEGGHSHDGAPGPAEEDRCTVSYRCGTDNGPDAFSLNPLETPFLLSTNCFVAALPIARPFKAVQPVYSGPYLPLPERPPSISL